MSIKDGGPAFPQTRDSWYSLGVRDDPRPVPDGMSLRDYAAIKFAAAWLPVICRGGRTDIEDIREANRLGLLQADAWLAEREKEQSHE